MALHQTKKKMGDNLHELDKNQRPIHPLPEGDIAHIRWPEMIKPDKTLNAAEILSIKRLKAKGVPYEDIAARIGISIERLKEME